ncbi:unnamed protein product [Brassica napus]|uniref:(rape) hypothetical protein n=1 Tax=Brassica napus TaxID=3708 RepID=A0A816IU27_BRANA|nr:unnamed protein product [Brassica napus]
MLTGSTPGCGELSIPITHTDMGLRFRAHLNTRREDLSVGCTSTWGLVWASPGAWDTPRYNNPMKPHVFNRKQEINDESILKLPLAKVLDSSKDISS